MTEDTERTRQAWAETRALFAAEDRRNRTFQIIAGASTALLLAALILLALALAGCGQPRERILMEGQVEEGWRGEGRELPPPADVLSEAETRRFVERLEHCP